MRHTRPPGVPRIIVTVAICPTCRREERRNTLDGVTYASCGQHIRIVATRAAHKTGDRQS